VVLINTRALHEALPAAVVPPLRFREKGRQFEGEVNHPIDLVKMFEPIDVLDGATELVDQKGVLITIEADDKSLVERNEYPADWNGIFYRVHDQGDSGQ
jgi:hypothetical protein